MQKARWTRYLGTMQHTLIAMTVAVITLNLGVARSQTYPRPVPYRGGPILNNVEIIPVFIGDYWSTSGGISAGISLEFYMLDLAGFINGSEAPAGQVPYLTQYGITSVSIGPSVTAGRANGTLSEMQIESILWNLHNSGQLPPLGSNVLIMVFAGNGLTPGIGATLAFHRAFGFLGLLATGYYGASFPGGDVPQGEAASHEIQEALTDPAWSNNHLGWAFDASHEICDDATCGHAEGDYVSFVSNGITIIGCADNTQGGQCTTTGYIPQ